MSVTDTAQPSDGDTSKRRHGFVCSNLGIERVTFDAVEFRQPAEAEPAPEPPARIESFWRRKRRSSVPAFMEQDALY